MPSRIALTVVASVAVLLLPSLLPSTATAARPAKAQNIAQVSYIKIGLGVTPPHKKERKGKVKMKLFGLYALRTRAKQKAAIKFRDRSQLYINQNSDLVLTSPHLTRVKKGEVQQVVWPGTQHQVQTAAAVCSAIGTKYDVKYNGKTMFVVVIEGAVSLSNGSGTIYIHTGQEGTANKNTAPKGPFPAPGKLSWTNGMPGPGALLKNIALAANGGVTVGTSSQTAGNFPASNLIDGNPNTVWQPQGTHDQWVKLHFHSTGVFQVTSIILACDDATGPASPNGLKSFQILVTTGSEGSSFTRVFSGTCRQSTDWQVFTFSHPVKAKFLELYAVDNYGGSVLQIGELEVIGQPPPPPPPNTCTPAACARYDLSLLNGTRGQNHLPPLSLSSCAGSYDHSKAMAKSQSLWHTNPSYPNVSFPKDICGSHNVELENVGVWDTGNPHQDLLIIHQQFMGEPHDAGTCRTRLTHACNILNSHVHTVSIGVYIDSHGTWLTEDFTG